MRSISNLRQDVLLIDDSIVRGTTSAQIIELAREAAQRKCILPSAAPPVRYPNVYRIDMPAPSGVGGGGQAAEEEVATFGADWLCIKISGFDSRLPASRLAGAGFDASCFSVST